MATADIETARPGDGRCLTYLLRQILARQASDRERARLATIERYRPLFGHGVRYDDGKLSMYR